ncbi:serine/threonine protein kinase [Auraticoccus sp. F435]|uniref:Serine/threonine protein kinase n=1 Tax=Auraticoccus cholistanensis TaxID=2656650 RepID=A0A6A9UTC7_9ACTN|nr:serine/threonine protein kinase [Auraticoccus cholistanensis]MVA75898.1 serine/threonine protein kinase [Auraticoccus cholistanensis]
MAPALTTTSSVACAWEDFLRQHGDVVAVFDHRTQGSGNVSWTVDTDDGRYFVKTAGPAVPPPGAPTPYLDHAGRVALLRTAVELSASCRHPALARLRNVIESPQGPALVYDWAPGELVRVPSSERGDPRSPYQRFARLPTSTLLGVFDRLIDLHRELGEQGWVAGDLYDGCLLYDFGTDRLTVVDLDTYHRGPSTNTMGRMFGSDTFMAPEEHVLGAVIDQRTTVFTLGRLVWHFGTRLTERRDRFVGPPALAEVVEVACHPDPARRHRDVAALSHAWRHARRR